MVFTQDIQVITNLGYKFGGYVINNIDQYRYILKNYNNIILFGIRHDKDSTNTLGFGLVEFLKHVFIKTDNIILYIEQDPRITNNPTNTNDTILNNVNDWIRERNITHVNIDIRRLFLSNGIYVNDVDHIQIQELLYYYEHVIER